MKLATAYLGEICPHLTTVPTDLRLIRGNENFQVILVVVCLVKFFQTDLFRDLTIVLGLSIPMHLFGLFIFYS